MLEWFSTSWAEFLKLDSIGQLSTIFTIGGVLLSWLASCWVVATRQLRLKRAELDHLQALCDSRFQRITDQESRVGWGEGRTPTCPRYD